MPQVATNRGPVTDLNEVVKQSVEYVEDNKPIGASPRRWLDSSCCLGLLGLLCCDHDDRVFPYNGYGNSMSIYVRNPSASLK